jgi:Protein of unknown function, DUF481
VEVEMRTRAVVCGTVLLSAALLVLAHAARAEEAEKKYGWFLTAEFSSVVATGNAESSTFGLTSTARRLWEFQELRVDVGGVRTDAALLTRTATGTQNDFTVATDKNRETTAESYYARARFDRNISKAFIVFGGVDWLRNPFAGIDSRVLLAAGGGNTWADNDDRRFKTAYSITYTFEEEVVENPFSSSKFAGVRLTYDYFQKLTNSTSFTSDMTADWNLDDTEDARLIFNFGLPISISSIFAFKPALNLQWRNQPALTDAPLFDTAGMDTGETVLVPLEKLDMIFTAALVMDI